MSSVEVRLACLDSPCRARSLFTVRAAISSASSSLRPRSSRPSLMCSYCRSRFFDHCCWGIPSRYPAWSVTFRGSRPAERLHQRLALSLGEVGADQRLVHAAEPLAEPVELALVGDEEQRRRTFHD